MRAKKRPRREAQYMRGQGYITLAEAADLILLSRSTLSNAVDAGTIVVQRSGVHVYVSLASLLRWAEAGNVAPAVLQRMRTKIGVTVQP